MRLTVFGANGGTGRALVEQALAAGHEVTAVTRHPESFHLVHQHLAVHAGDATDPASVASAVGGADAVLSALGARYSRKPIDLYSTSARAIVDGMRAAGVRRFAGVTSSALASGSQGSFLFDRVIEPSIRLAGRTLYADMRRMEDVVAASDLDWTIVRPAALFDSPTAGVYEVGEGFVRGTFSARQDVASFLLRQAADTDHIGKRMGVVSPGAHPNVLGIIWRDGIRGGR